MLRTPAFEAYITAARQYPQIWRILVGILVMFAVYLLPLMLIFAAVGVLMPDAVYEITLALTEPDTALAMFILLATFFFMGLGAVVAALIHRRGLDSLIGPFRPACGNFSRAILMCLLVFGGTGAVVSFVYPDSPTPNLALSEWLAYLPFALPLLLIQTGSEELVFRGYLMQQLAARFKNAFIWMGIPTILFGLAHYSPEIDPKLAILIICATGLFGLAAADLTRVTGNLGAAIGFHFTNNFFALFLVSIAGEMSGLSLYLAPFTMDDVEKLAPLMILDMVTVVVTWGLLRRWLRPV